MQIHEILDFLKDEIKEMAYHNYNMQDFNSGPIEILIFKSCDFMNITIGTYVPALDLYNTKLTIYFYKCKILEQSRLYSDDNTGLYSFNYKPNSPELRMYNIDKNQEIKLSIPFQEEAIFQGSTIMNVPDISVLNSMFSISEHILEDSIVSDFVIYKYPEKQVSTEELDNIKSALNAMLSKVQNEQIF